MERSGACGSLRFNLSTSQTFGWIVPPEDEAVNSLYVYFAFIFVYRLSCVAGRHSYM